ncbi:MAG: hypothetical protein ACRDX8_04985 [Acidimicrobiales bacterium]
MDETDTAEVTKVAQDITKMCTDLRGRRKDRFGWSFPGEHRFHGSVMYHAMDEWIFNAQFTADIRMGRVAKIMEDLGNPENEDPQLTAARSPGRRMLMGDSLNAVGTGRRIMGSAPGWARAAIGELHDQVGGVTFGPNTSDALVGMLAVMVQYVKLGSQTIPSYAKVIAPLMSRHNLAKLFSDLPDAQRNYLASNNGRAMVILLIRAANRVTGFHTRDVLYVANRPVLSAFSPSVADPAAPGGTRNLQVLNDVTIEAWARGITRGQDLLSSADYSTWAARQNNGVGMSQAQQAGAAQLESLGAKGMAKRGTDASGAKGTAFEMRAAAGSLRLADIEGYMLAITKYFRQVAKGKPAVLRPPG